MQLRRSNIRYNTQDLEGVLAVLDGRLDDGASGDVVLHTDIRAEASADLDFGFGGSERLLAVVVGRWYGGVCKEGKDVIPVLGNTLLEFVQSGFLSVFAGVYGRSCKQLVKLGFHLLPDFRSQDSLVALVDGVSEEVQHVQAPGIIREGLHRIGEIAQQVRNAYLMVFHPDLVHEVGGPAVCDPDHPALFFLGKVLVHNPVTAALVKGDVGSDLILEGPQPVVLALDVDPGFIRPGYLAACDLLPDHLVGGLRELAHRIQHVGDGAFADMKPEDGLVQVREPFERDILIGAEVRGKRHDVGAVGHRRINILRELPLAAMAAGTLDLHLIMVHNRRHNRERDVHHLTGGTYRRHVHIQRLSALGAHRGGIPVLEACDILCLQPRAALMSLLAAGLAPGRLAQGLRVRYAYRVLGRGNAAVCAGLDNGFHSAFKFRDAGLQFFNLSFLADKAAVQDIIDKGLLVQLLCKFSGVQVLGEPHIPEELLAPPGEFHLVCLKALAKPGVKVLSHTTKIGKRFDICKFNTLSIN